MYYSTLRTLSLISGLAISMAGCQFGPQSMYREPLPTIDHILVEKGNRTITVFHKKQALKTYNISLGKSPVGAKVAEGDHKTPEGVYTITAKNPNDKFFKSLTISYPNAQDIKNATTLGVSTGGGIKIHGYEDHLSWVSQHHPLLDATRGCILLTNPEMAQIYAATPVGTKIVIQP
jgi:murein L,D-transpeptidase YafK